MVTVFSHFRDVSASVCVCSGYYYRLGFFSSVVPNYQEKKVNLSSCWKQHQTQARITESKLMCGPNSLKITLKNPFIFLNKLLQA